MKIKLKPCPFCGFAKPFFLKEEVSMCCIQCGTQGPMGVDEEISSINWNKRFPPKKGLRR